MNLIPLFPTAVAKFELGRNFSQEEIAFIENQPTYKNTGNTTSENRYVFREDALSDLSKFVEGCVAQYLSAIYAPKNEVSLRVTQSWLNYTKPGQYHHKHYHPNSFISGVLYIKADKAKDKIYFYKDGYQQIKLNTDNFNYFNSDSWWIDVGTTELILFPSSLTHMVQVVEGDERISLSFNTFPVGYVGQENELTALHV